MSMKLSIKADIEELLVKRQLICEIVKENGFFGSDYTNKYIWDKEDHPYKNLCNYILWCEYWIKKIKISNNRQKIMPKIRAAEILAINEELEQHVLSANSLAQKIRTNILEDNVDLSDIELGLKQYHSEQKLFEAITPNVEFLRPKLELLYEIITKMPEVIEKNRMITEDFKNCFKGNNLTLKKLKSNLNKLVLQYGIEELNKYAKIAWMYHEVSNKNYFNIQLILDDISLFMIDKSQLLNNIQSVEDSEFIEHQIFRIFFNEIFTIYNAYQEVKIVLEKINKLNVNTWDLTLLTNILLLYKDIQCESRYELINKIKFANNYLPSYEELFAHKQQVKENNLLWRVAIRPIFLSKDLIMQIQLSQENKWQIYHYKLAFELNKIITDTTIIEQYNFNESVKVHLLSYIRDYIYNKQMNNIYKIGLIFIEISFLELYEPFSEIRRIVMVFLQYNHFKIIYR
jgi:hypothetical protein